MKSVARCGGETVPAAPHFHNMKHNKLLSYICRIFYVLPMPRSTEPFLTLNPNPQKTLILQRVFSVYNSVTLCDPIQNVVHQFSH